MAWLLSPTVVVAIGVLLSALGAVLLLLGLRGKLMSRAPHCRGCGFDLTGLPEPLTSRTCPECGRELGARTRAIRQGRRRKRISVTLVGVLMLLVGLGGLGALGWGKASGFNWNTIKPVWLLEQNILYGEYDTAIGASEEIRRRVNSLKPTSAEFSKLVELAVRLDEARADAEGLPALGDVILIGRIEGHVSDTTYIAFVLRAVGVSFSVRDVARLDVPIELAPSAGGTNRNEEEPVFVRARIRSVSLGGRGLLGVNGEPLDITWVFKSSALSSGTGCMATSMPVPRALAEQVPLVIEYDLEVLNNEGGFGMRWTDDDPVHSVVRRHEQRISISGPETRLVEVVSEPPADQMRTSFSIELTELRAGSGRLSLSVRVQDPPANSSFRVMVVIDESGTEHEVGSFTYPASVGTQFFGYTIGDDVPIDKSRPIGVILRTDVEAAEQEPGFDSVWNGELSYDVALERTEAGDDETKPTTPTP